MDEDMDALISRYRLVILYCLSYVAFTQGIQIGLIGATLTELTLKLRVTYDELSFAYGMIGLTMMVGAPVGGVLVDRFRSHHVLLQAVDLLLISLVEISVPFCNNLWTFGMLAVAQGFLYSASITGVHAYAAGLWKENFGQSTAFILVFLFIGKMIPAPIAAPFLSSYENYTQSRAIQDSPTTDEGAVYEGKVHYPFVICAAIMFGGTVSLTIVYFVFNKYSTQFWPYIKPPGETATSSQSVKKDCYSIVITICLTMMSLCLFFAIYGAGDFLFSIAVSNKLQMSNMDAANLNVVYQVAAIVGNLIAIVIMHFINVTLFINMTMLAAVLTGVVATIWGLESVSMFCITTTLLMSLYAPMMSSHSAYSNTFIPATGKVLGVIQTGYGLGRLLMNLISGNLFQRYGSQAVLMGFTLVTVIALIISLGIVILRLIVNWMKKERLNDDQRHPLFRSESN